MRLCQRFDTTSFSLNLLTAYFSPIRVFTIKINKKKVCQNAHLHYFTYKAPTFTSWGFVIT